jgi:hypothetical protein
MGAHQSVPGTESEESATATKTCYYELIGVGIEASDAECVYTFNTFACTVTLG